LNKWDFLMVFQGAREPIRDTCKSLIRGLIAGLKNRDFWTPEAACAIRRAA
jgi:hypothetical protein